MKNNKLQLDDITLSRLEQEMLDYALDASRKSANEMGFSAEAIHQVEDLARQYYILGITVAKMDAPDLSLN